jgi:DNA-binding SARP family transcriptional activator/TolB-like protein/Flp pilus assembly protein TadD
MTSSPARPTSHYHRLITFGRLTLITPDGIEDPSLGTRRRKLAVLAYLALRGQPATRDHLTALFWGGKDDERARNSLSDALSHLRRVLGRHSIVTRGDEVALATDAPVAVDALELIEAAEARDWARATSLYGGPFLDGVHIDDAPEFDQWCTAEGRRLQRVFSRVCAPHARALADEGRWDACSDLAARWLAAEPASTEAALYRLNALKAPGTNGALTAALDEYERLRARLAEELDVGVDAAVKQLAASIRAELPPVVPEQSAASVATPLPHTDADAGREVRRDGSPHIAPVAATAARATWPRTGARLGVLLATLMVIIGAAAYGSRHAAKDPRVILAVLPFENVGAPGDAYFAEGLTDEVRARLTALSGLQVIGGASARQYRGTTKPPREIARELGATHLLTGSVRWQRSPDGRGRVRVSVELVRAADQANVWAEPVEGPLDEIFAMQAQVATRVASALDVKLLAREGTEMTARPTTNLAAYDAYLRGRASISSATRFSAADRRATLEEFERAVALDPKFAAAHAQIAWAHLRDYEQAGDPTAAAAALAKFRAAAEQAWALDSTLVDTRLVRARYLEIAGDFSAATLLVRTMARAAPGNVEVLGVLGETEERSGRREAAVAAYRQAMALDPRAVEAWVSFAGLLDGLYRHEEAIAVREHEIELTPNSDVAYAVQASSHLLSRGDTAAARRTLERGSRTLPWVVRLPGGVAGITIWERVLPPSVLSARDTLTLPGYLAGAGGIAPELYYLVKLRHFQARGRADRARAYADSLVARLVPAVRAGGDAPWFFWWFSRRSVLAEAFASLERNAEAARETDDYVSETRRRVTSPGLAQGELCHALHNAAYVDVLVGRKGSAVARLREAFDLPCGSRVSRALLRVDPAWAPLRGHPAFERLIGGGP